MIRPIAEYAATIWCPHTQSSIYNLERIQRKAARFVSNNYQRYSSVTAMMRQLNWPTLEQRRYEAKAIMMYKILNDLVQVNHSDLVYNSSVTRGHSLRLLHILTRVDVYSYSFFPSTIRIWNKLPEDIVISPSLDLFKLKLYNHYMYVNTPFWGPVH